jgi:TonB family protein
MKTKSAKALCLLAVLGGSCAIPARAQERPAGEVARTILRHMGATIESCPQQALDQFPGHLVICAVYPKTFSFFKFDWETQVKRHDVRKEVSATTPWTIRDDRYVREYDAGGTEVTVEFHAETGRLLVAFVPPDTGEDEAPESPPGRGEPAGDVTASAAQPPRLAGFGGVSLPRIIPDSRVDPDVPDRLIDAGRDGSVLLSLIVRRDGTVDEVHVLRAEPAGWGLEESATRAVRKWRYEPALFEGKPVDVQHTIRVRFTHPDPS